MKKRLISTMLIGALMITMSGCQSKKVNDPSNNKPAAAGTQNLQNGAMKDDTSPKPDINASKPVSEYISNTPVKAVDAIQISPHHVYFKDSKLYMDAYVYNGYNHNVFDIKNIDLRLSNKSGVIAEASFEKMENAQLGPNSYIVWTFVFDKDTIKMPNADLQYLKTEFQCSNSY